MTILVIGGAGYIGSHMVNYLLSKNEKCIVLDDLSTGHRCSIKSSVPFYEGDFSSPDVVKQIIARHKISCVMHFAASSQVAESVSKPDKYYRNNFVKTKLLLDVLREENVKDIVFSSTAAVYGSPTESPIKESHNLLPINPYGRTKLAIEWLLEDYVTAYDFRVVTLRYFNAAGAEIDASNGENHNPETHLIPLVLQTISGRKACLSIFGNNHPTPDGTCVRDYVHVVDLAQAHYKAMKWLQLQNPVFKAFNLGNGKGFSIIEVINTAQDVTGIKLNYAISEPRVGDPPSLVACSDQARTVLGWRPHYSNLKEIVTHAWNWEKVLFSTV